jgi:hypothetical protein
MILNNFFDLIIDSITLKFILAQNIIVLYNNQSQDLNFVQIIFVIIIINFGSFIYKFFIYFNHNKNLDYHLVKPQSVLVYIKNEFKKESICAFFIIRRYDT